MDVRDRVAQKHCELGHVCAAVDVRARRRQPRRHRPDETIVKELDLLMRQLEAVDPRDQLLKSIRHEEAAHDMAGVKELGHQMAGGDVAGAMG